MRIVTYESIIPGPDVKFRQHPVWWWRMRHLRRSIKRLERNSLLTDELMSRLRRREDEVFLLGKGNTNPGSDMERL